MEVHGDLSLTGLSRRLDEANVNRTILKALLEKAQDDLIDERRLLRYRIVKSLLSLEATVEWVRRKTMHLLIHRIKDAATKISTRSILHLIDTS